MHDSDVPGHRELFNLEQTSAALIVMLYASDYGVVYLPTGVMPGRRS
jgi:hypothetical protein